MKTLLESLNDHPIAMLRGIAVMRDIDLASNVRTEAAAQLAAALADSAATEIALSACSALGRSAWNDLIRTDGRNKTPAFQRTYGAIRPVGPGRLEREQTWLHPQNAAEELWYRGLIFKAFADFGSGAAEYTFIPSDLLPPGTLSRPSRELLDPADAPPHTQQAYNTFAVDMVHLISAMRDMPAHIDTDEHLASGEAGRFLEVLLLRDTPRLDLLIAAASGLGWLVRTRRDLGAEPLAFARWLKETHWEQMSALFSAWRESSDPATDGTLWSDLRHVPELVIEGKLHHDARQARETILARLAMVDRASWYEVDGFISWIKEREPDFLRPDGNYGTWYLRDAATGRALSGFECWDDVEGRLVRFMVVGPLFWLGAVALGVDANGRVDRFRLTHSGAAWMSGTLSPTLPKPTRLRVDENFTITAPLLLPLLDRYRLLRFSEPAGADYQPGSSTTHRITRASLARARSAGLNAQALLGFLRRTNTGEVSPRVAAALNRWDQHHGTVRLTKGVVLRVEDASLLSTLRADSVLAPMLRELLSAQAALVRESDLPRVLSALRELGYKVESG